MKSADANPGSGSSGPSGKPLSPVLYMPRRLAQLAGRRVWLEWRGQALASPPTLEAVSPGTVVKVVRRWSEQGVPFVKLADPEIGSEVDCSVQRLTGDQGTNFAVLELAPGWPGEQAGHRSLVRVVDRDAVRTLTTDDFNEVVARCGEVLAGEAVCSVPDAEAVFGAMPDWLSPEFRAQEKALRAEREQGREIRCFHCEKPIADAEAVCPHCSVSRLAPRCPRCGGLVSPERDSASFTPMRTATILGIMPGTAGVLPAGSSSLPGW